MAFVRKKMSWDSFFSRLLILLVLMFLVGLYGLLRYRIGIDTQEDRCLPDTQVYLIDLWDQEPVRDGLYAFRAQGLAPLYKNGTRMLKRMSGLPGDTVVVTPEHVLVNDKVVTEGLALAGTLGVKPEQLRRTLTLAEGEFWFTGSAPGSFDSRYWNTVKTEQLVGRAWPLW